MVGFSFTNGKTLNTTTDGTDDKTSMNKILPIKTLLNRTSLHFYIKFESDQINT